MNHSIWITNLEQHLESMKISIASMEQKHYDITNEISQTEQKIQNIDKNIEMLEKVAIILATSSSSLRESARVHFEKIVTYALQYITQSNNYSFVIKDNKIFLASASLSSTACSTAHFTLNSIALDFSNKALAFSTFSTIL